MIKASNIDIIVSRPTSKNLFKAYDKALLILDNIKTQHQIKEEAELVDYLEYAVGSVRELSF